MTDLLLSEGEKRLIIDGIKVSEFYSLIVIRELQIL